MVDAEHDRLSITRQCRLMSIARSSFYYEGTGESPLNLRLMRVIDEQFLETPFYGSRQMTRWLRRQGRPGLSEAGAPPDAAAGGARALPAAPGRLSRTRRTGSIPTCCAMCRSHGRTTCVHGCHLHPPAAGAFCTWSP